MALRGTPGLDSIEGLRLYTFESWVVEGRQPGICLVSPQSFLAQEIDGLVPSHGETQARFEVRVFHAYIVTPVAICLLHPARIHRMHAGKRQSELPAGIAQLFEDMKSKFSRDVELPTPRAGLSAKTLRKQKLPVHIAFTVNHTLATFSLAQEGSGIAVVDPFPMLLGSFPKLVMRPFHPAIESRPRVLLSKTRPTSVISGMFVKTMQAVADEMVAESRLLLRLPQSRA